ncbi:60s ribosomal protein l6 [Nannochloropsis oceanica]
MAPKKVNKRAGKPRTTMLARGVPSLSHSATVKKGGRYKFFGKGGKKAVTAAPATGKAPRFYPADDIPVPRRSARHVQKPTKLKAGIVPGSILIMLAGRFRGKRVVFLKQLASGTLLVTGPYSLNGVPLRRVNQAYVIVTSQAVDISAVKVPATMDDNYFARPADAEEGDILAAGTGKKATVVSEGRKKDQEAVDTQVLAAIKKVPQLDGYVKARFSLKKGVKPHEIKF